MKSFVRGKAISKVEIQNISTFGLWLFVEGQEFFLSYDRHPWFKNATVAEISKVQFLFGHHLHWPDLDVDLDIDSLVHPEKYPLVAKHPRRGERRPKKAA